MTTESKSSLFLVGKIIGFRGLRGEVKILPQTNSPELLLDIKTVTILPTKGSQLQASVHDIRIQKRILFLTFAGFADRQSVESLAQAEVYVPRKQLLELREDEFWVADLVGLDAFTTTGASIGKVISIIDGATQIMEISSTSPGKTILVPLVKQLVPTIDFKGARVEIIDLPGLLEPQ